MLKKMKIRGRLIFGFAVVLICLILSTLVGLMSLKHANTRIEDMVQYPVAANESIKMCRIEVNVAARLIREMALNPDTSTYPDYRSQVKEATDVLNTNLDKLEASYTYQDNLVSDYRAEVNLWLDVAEKLMTFIENGQMDQFREGLFNECVPKLNDLVNMSHSIDTKILAQLEGAIKGSLNNVNYSSVALFICATVAVILGIILSTSITAGIVKPLRELDIAASEMAKGNLQSEIKYHSGDAVGQVAESMRQSMQILSSYIKDIDRAMEEMSNGNFDLGAAQPFVGEFANIEHSIDKFLVDMSRTLMQIDQSSDQVAVGSEQVSSGAQELSQSSAQQSSSIEELAVTMTDISNQIRENAKNAEEANQMASGVGAVAEESNSRMQDMLNAMSDISGSSKEIGKIIKTIEDIAFQTNILALNAAVEAARAGSAGKGFAVVADEVRSLASKSQDASKSTAELIERSLRVVENGTKIADDTAKSLTSVIEGVRNVATTIDKISVASKTQAESASNVTGVVDQIAAAVQVNSSTTEESAAASEELSSQAQILKDLIKKFRLKNTVVSSAYIPETAAAGITQKPARKQQIVLEDRDGKY